MKVFGYVGGLGGRDITETTLQSIFRELLDIKGERQREPAKLWIDARPEAMGIRPFGGTVS